MASPLHGSRPMRRRSSLGYVAILVLAFGLGMTLAGAATYAVVEWTLPASEAPDSTPALRPAPKAGDGLRAAGC